MSAAALELYWSRVRSFAKSNWKYALAFGLGSIATAVWGFFFAKSVTGLNTKWLIVNTIIGKYKQKYRNVADVTSYAGFSRYPHPMRPSNELIAWDAFFRDMKKKATMDYKTPAKEFRAHFMEYRRANLAQRNRREALPDFIPTPEEVIISKTSAKNNGPLKGLILTYPGAKKENGAVLWIHGGGFFLGYPEEGYSMLRIMAQYLGIIAFSVDYHYCPEISIPQQVDECIAAYKYLVNTIKVDPSKVFICGASAGGLLTLLTLQKLKALQMARPCGGIIVSGPCDATWKTQLKCEQGSDGSDGIQDAMYYTVPSGVDICVDDSDRKRYDEGDQNRKDKILLSGRYSPLNGDWKGMCPLYISASQNEALVDDSKLMVAKCKEFGVDYEADFDPYLVHATVAFADVIPEARDKLILIIQWMKKLLNVEQS